MIKKFLPVWFVFVITSQTFAFSLIPVPKDIDIYLGSSYLTWTINTNKKEFEIKFPEKVNLSELSFSVLPVTCYMNYIEEKKPVKIPEATHIMQKIESLKNYLNTLNKELTLLEKIKLSDDLSQKINQFEKIYFEKLENIRRTKVQIKNLEKELSDITKKSKNIFKIKLSCNSNRVKISFKNPVKIFATQEYAIKGNMTDSTITIINRLQLKNETGIDLKNINVNYYTYRKTTAIEPPPFERPFPAMGIKKLAIPQKKTQLEYIQTQTKSYFSAKNITLPSKTTKKITIGKIQYKAEFDIFIDGYATVTPFLRAKFTADRLFPPSYNVKFYIDGIFIGKGRIKSITEGKNNLFFGEDTFIDVSKILIKDFQEETFFGKKIRTKKWRYEIKNRHTKRISITLVDKIPVSTTEKIKIKPFSTIKWKEIKPNGKIIWEIKLNPQQTLKFDFGYNIEKTK
jgi:hypothetical protein